MEYYERPLSIRTTTAATTQRILILIRKVRIPNGFSGAGEPSGESSGVGIVPKDKTAGEGKP